MPGLLQNHVFVKKNWGSELWPCNSEKYCGKILKLDHNKNCSFHYHRLKDEVLLVQSGLISFRYANLGDTEIKEDILRPNMAWHVIPGLVHQMLALEETTIIEFSTQHFDSDSYRITTDLVSIGPCDLILPVD